MPERIVAGWAEAMHVPPPVLKPVLWALKASKSGAYLLLLAAGLLNLFPGMQPQVLRDTTESQVQLYTWAVVLIVSGGLCSYGSLRDVWWGEYIGLIPLFLICVIYGGSALFIGDGGITRGMFLLALGLLVLARWEERAIQRAVAVREARARERARDDPPG